MEKQDSKTSSQQSAWKKTKVIGKYQIGDYLGQGGSGRVYKGFNLETGQTVAIKQFEFPLMKRDKEKKQKLKERTQSEINMLKKLDHPNIVKYIDSIETKRDLNIIMEYVENGSLDSLVKKFGAFPESLAAIYIQQILQGLCYLHYQGVVHRDIKGGNILTTKEGEVKLADFGVATKMQDNDRKNNSFVGTPFWMAPEVINSDNFSYACDIWSLGCTVIELVEGKPPYYAMDPRAVMLKICQEESPPMPATASKDLKDFLSKCLVKDPEKRSKADQLLEHPWITRFSKKEFQKIMSISSQLPQDISNTIRHHMNQSNRVSMQEEVKQEEDKPLEIIEPLQVEIEPDLGDKECGLVSLEGDDSADIDEEVLDQQDALIEKPKCIDGIQKMQSMNYLDSKTNKEPSSKMADKMYGSGIMQQAIKNPFKAKKQSHGGEIAKTLDTPDMSKEYMNTQPAEIPLPGEKFSFFPQGPMNEQILLKQVQNSNQNMISKQSKSSNEHLISPTQLGVGPHHLHCQTSVPAQKINPLQMSQSTYMKQQAPSRNTKTGGMQSQTISDQVGYMQSNRPMFPQKNKYHQFSTSQTVLPRKYQSIQASTQNQPEEDHAYYNRQTDSGRRHYQQNVEQRQRVNSQGNQVNQVIVPRKHAPSIEQHIKHTQLSDGRAPPTRQWTNSHVQHRSVLSNYMSPGGYGSNGQSEERQPAAYEGFMFNDFEQTTPQQYNLTSMQDLIVFRKSINQQQLYLQQQDAYAKQWQQDHMPHQDQLKAVFYQSRDNNLKRSGSNGRSIGYSGQQQMENYFLKQVQGDAQESIDAISTFFGKQEHNQDDIQSVFFHIQTLDRLLKDQNEMQLLQEYLLNNLNFYYLLRLVKRQDAIPYAVLQLINQLVENQAQVQEKLVFIGFTNEMIRLSKPSVLKEIKIEIAYFIGQIFQCSRDALAMLISSGGIEILMNLLAVDKKDFAEDEQQLNGNWDLMFLGIDSLRVLFNDQAQSQTHPFPQEELTLLMLDYGLLPKLAICLQIIYEDSSKTQDVNTTLNITTTEKYLEKCFELIRSLDADGYCLKLCESSLFDTVLNILQQSFELEESDFTFMIHRQVTSLLQDIVQETNTFEVLEQKGIMEVLVNMFKYFLACEDVNLQLLYDIQKLINTLCRLSQARCEQAILSKLIDQFFILHQYVQQHGQDISKSKRFKLIKLMVTIIHELERASEISRKALTGFKVPQLLLQIVTVIQQQRIKDTAQGLQNTNATSSSKEAVIFGKVLDTFIHWLDQSPHLIEGFLSKQDTLETFVNIFLINPRSKVFLQVFSALNIITKTSTRVAQALSQQQHLVEQFTSRLFQWDLTMQDDSKQLLPKHHSRNSASARSINQLMAFDSSQLNKADSVNTYQSQILKEVLDLIYTQAVISPNGPKYFLDKFKLVRPLQQVAKFADLHQLVILQEVTSELLSSCNIHEHAQSASMRSYASERNNNAQMPLVHSFSSRSNFGSQGSPLAQAAVSMKSQNSRK